MSVVEKIVGGHKRRYFNHEKSSVRPSIVEHFQERPRNLAGSWWMTKGLKKFSLVCLVFGVVNWRFNDTINRAAEVPDEYKEEHDKMYGDFRGKLYMHFYKYTPAGGFWGI